MMNSEMRSAVIKHHHAKVEIDGMDSELPITIFIMSRVRCRQMHSNLQYVRQYLKSIDENDNQEIVLNTITMAVDYITSEWNIADIRKKKSSQNGSHKSKSPSPEASRLSGPKEDRED